MLGSQWSEALAAKNIRAIIFWLEKLAAEGGLRETLSTFNCWIQKTSELTEKELETLCFSRCQGLWMFLDRSSFVKVHVLLQRLQNLLTLVQWARKQLCPCLSCHGVGVSCVITRDTCDSSDFRHSSWNRLHRTLKQHIWLGRLVQWWGIMGLLPKFPEAQEQKRISQMWKEMELNYLKTSLKTPGWEKGEKERYSFLIEGIVMQLGRKGGCIWTSGGCTDPFYPPPNLQVLLKLVLVPHVEKMSIQAILMYFIMDVANFLQCKDDLLQSFCHAFTIPYSFSQQIKAFWMFDHGHFKTSMELLLSPRALVPRLSWQHRCIICSLLTRKQPLMALRYYQWTRPAIETIEDAKLCASVLLQCRCISEAWALLKRGHTESHDMVMYFLQACEEFNLHEEALKHVPEEFNGEEYCCGVEATVLELKKKDSFANLPPCPLSAKLYEQQRGSLMSSEELFRLVQKAVIEVRKPHPKMSEVVWPRRKSKSWEIFLSRGLTPSPLNVVEEAEQAAHTDDSNEEYYTTNHKQPETSEEVSSCENLSSVSVSSFSSASPPLLKHPYVYERTVTLQRISSLLTDQEEIQSEDKEEDDESRNSSPTDSFRCCPELMLTPDGTTEPISLSSFHRETSMGQMAPAEGGEEVDTAFPGEDNSDGASGTFFSLNKEEEPDSFPIASADQKGCEHHLQEEPGCSGQGKTVTSDLTYLNQTLVSKKATITNVVRMDNRTSSSIQGDSYAYRLFNSMDFTATERDDEQQAEKKEPTGWTEKTSLQGAIRSGRTRSRKSKRVKTHLQDKDSLLK